MFSLTPLVSCDKNCSPKFEGGMEIRRTKDVNVAVLAENWMENSHCS